MFFGLVKWYSYAKPRQHTILTIDLSERTDNAARIVREASGSDEIKIHSWGGGAVSF